MTNGIDTKTIFKYWRDRIPRDLMPFCDPGTELLIDASGRTVKAEITLRGQVHIVHFNISIPGVNVNFMNKQYSYKSFFSLPEMADLLGLAKMMLQARQEEIFVSTKALAIDEENPTQRPAVDLIRKILNEESEDSTRILMITGDAGAGKTKVLQELIKRQANDYLKGETSTLYLYVNAQGRALARLKEALATELQDLRALLTYHAVAPIVRLGLLVLVIDGFDELLGVSGYDDAFSSLAGFVEELDGEGQIVASARSTYYEEEFMKRATSVSSLGGQVWTQIPIRVSAWEDSEFDEYIKKKLLQRNVPDSSTDDYVQKINDVFKGRNKDLKEKPLFFAKIVDLVFDNIPIKGGEDLLGEVVEIYLNREGTEKLLDKNETSLLSTKQIALLVESLAEEMWNQETRELDRRSIREIAEYVLEIEGINEADQAIIIERMPTMAFLTTGEKAGGIAFEHEIFFSFFLSHVFAESLAKGGPSFRMLLSRSVLPPSIGETTVKEMFQSLPDRTVDTQKIINDIRDIVHTICTAGKYEGVRMSQIRENGGRLVLNLLKTVPRGIELNNFVFESIIFPGEDLDYLTITKSRFSNVQFRRTDLSKTKIMNCEANDTRLYEITIDPDYTRLELGEINYVEMLYGLRVIKELGAYETIYDPAAVKEMLISCGAVGGEAEDRRTYNVKPNFIKLLERLVAAYRKSNPVCMADEHLENLFVNKDWRKLQQLLIRHDLISHEIKHTSGRPKEFLRRKFQTEELMVGIYIDSRVPEKVKNFWSDLQEISP